MRREDGREVLPMDKCWRMPSLAGGHLGVLRKCRIFLSWVACWETRTLLFFFLQTTAGFAMCELIFATSLFAVEGSKRCECRKLPKLPGELLQDSSSLFALMLQLQKIRRLLCEVLANCFFAVGNSFSPSARTASSSTITLTSSQSSLWQPF